MKFKDKIIKLYKNEYNTIMEPEAQVRRGDGINTVASDMRDMRINHVRDKVLTGDTMRQVGKHLKAKDLLNLASVSKTYYKALGPNMVPRSNPKSKQAIREVYRDVALHNDYKTKHRQYQMLHQGERMRLAHLHSHESSRIINSLSSGSSE